MHPRRAIIQRVQAALRDAFGGRVDILEEPTEATQNPPFVGLILRTENARDLDRGHANRHATGTVRLLSLRVAIIGRTPEERDDLSEVAERALLEELVPPADLSTAGGIMRVQIESAEFARTPVGAGTAGYGISMFCDVQYLAVKGLPV